MKEAKEGRKLREELWKKERKSSKKVIERRKDGWMDGWIGKVTDVSCLFLHFLSSRGEETRSEFRYRPERHETPVFSI